MNLHPSIKRLMVETRASVEYVIGTKLHRPSFVEEHTCTLTGSEQVTLVPYKAAKAFFSAPLIAGVVIGLVFSAVSSFQALPASQQAVLVKQFLDSGQQKSVEQPVVGAPVQLGLSPLQRMLRARDERRARREEIAANREPLHAAAPERLAPTTLSQRGVYLSAPSVGREGFLSGTVDSLEDANGNAVIFDVKGSGVLYNSQSPAAREIGLIRSYYDLKQVINDLHEQGIEAIGRFVAIKDAAYTQRRPDTRIIHPETGRPISLIWIDPANEDAITFNMQVICELAAAGMDEINLDYIRFSTAEVGALSAFTGHQKADRLEKFISAARETINRCGPSTRLGLSTFAILGWQYDQNVETLGQDVVRFAPLVDVISPMAYPATFSVGGYYNPYKHPGSRMYYLVYRTMTGYRELLGKEHAWKLRPWIQGYGVTTKNMQDQIHGVYDSGSCGYLVWNASNAYSPTFMGMRTTEVPPECQQEKLMKPDDG